MRLALVTRRYPPLIGGAEAMLRYLARALAVEGADVAVLTSRLGVEGEPVEERDESAGGGGGGSLRVARLATSRLRFVGTSLYMNNLRRRLEADPPDLAYVSMLKHDAHVAVGVGRARGFPVVLRPEGAGATGDVAWQAWGRFGRRIAARCKLADAIVSIDPRITAELVAAGYDPNRIVALPNGVPVPATSWHRRAGWGAAPVAVSVGRLAPEKGHASLVAAWPTVRRRFPAARLVLVGDGPERPSLEEQLARLQLRGAVELAGALDSDAVAARLRAADLFVLPSREEGMSIALLEAMALGLPVAASAIPGNARLVDDGVHGRLFRPDDPADLARVIIDQWTAPERAATMGRTARARVDRDHSIAAVARRHLELFERLRAARRPGG